MGMKNILTILILIALAIPVRAGMIYNRYTTNTDANATAAVAAVAASNAFSTTNNGSLDTNNSPFFLMQKDRRPPAKWVGFNSWYLYTGAFKSTDLTNILTTLSAMNMSNLVPGFVIGIDDGWTAGTNSDGTVYSDSTKWPAGMKAASDLIHSYGFRSQIYYEPRTNTSGGFPSSQNYMANLTNFAAWGFNSVKFDHTMTVPGSFPAGGFGFPAGLNVVQTGWSAFAEASTNNNIFMECSAPDQIGPLTNQWEYAQLLPSINIRIGAGDWSGVASWTNFMDAACTMSVAGMEWIQAAGSEVPMTGNYVQNNLAGGTNFTAAMESFCAVENTPIVYTALDSPKGTSAEQLRVTTNAEVYTIFFDPGPPGTMIASNANYVSWCKFMASGQRAVTVMPWDATNNHTATITLQSLRLPPGQNIHVWDYWAGTQFDTNADFTMIAPTNGAVTVLITPNNLSSVSQLNFDASRTNFTLRFTPETINKQVGTYQGGYDPGPNQAHYGYIQCLLSNTVAFQLAIGGLPTNTVVVESAVLCYWSGLSGVTFTNGFNFYGFPLGQTTGRSILDTETVKNVATATNVFWIYATNYIGGGDLTTAKQILLYSPGPDPTNGESLHVWEWDVYGQTQP